MAELNLPIVVNLPTKDVVRAMLQKCLDYVDTLDLPDAHIEAAAPAPGAGTLPAIGTEFAGGLYAGLSIEDNRPVHLVLLPGDNDDASWEKQRTWAAAQGGDLPSRLDALLLLQNLPAEFRKEAYWTNTQVAGDESYAWYQSFDYGYQCYGHKSDELRARAVRRLPIE